MISTSTIKHIFKTTALPRKALLHKPPVSKVSKTSISAITLNSTIFSTSTQSRYQSSPAAMASTIPTTMRAVVSNLPASESPALELKTVPVPTPQAGELLVRVRATGLNPSDAANALANRFRREKPAVMGRDFAGTIVAAPSDPSLVGKRVWGGSGSALSLSRDGTMSEYLLLPRDGVAFVPEGVSFVQAGALGTPYSTAYLALEKAQLRAIAAGEKPQTVLVLAATGAVGKAATQLARARGHRVITTSRRDGMDINIKTDPKLEKMGELTNGKGADVVVDAAGDVALAEAAMAVMGRRGRYTVITAKGGEEIKVNWQRLYSREQSVLGIHSGAFTLAENQRAMQEVADFITAGKIEIEKEEKYEQVSFVNAIDTYPKAMGFDGKKYVFIFDE